MTVLDHLRSALAGRYLVERELGQGGMATVYLARDLKHDRPVAIKVLRPELGAALGAERFLREIQITADFLRWSPTGPSLAYHAADGLRLVPAAGGPSRLLVDNTADGGEAFLAGWGIRAVPAAGGATRGLVDFADPARQPARYGFSTDGRRFYVTIGNSESDVWVMRLEVP